MSQRLSQRVARWDSDRGARSHTGDLVLRAAPDPISGASRSPSVSGTSGL